MVVLSKMEDYCVCREQARPWGTLQNVSGTSRSSSDGDSDAVAQGRIGHDGLPETMADRKSTRIKDRRGVPRRPGLKPAVRGFRKGFILPSVFRFEKIPPWFCCKRLLLQGIPAAFTAVYGLLRDLEEIWNKENRLKITVWLKPDVVQRMDGWLRADNCKKPWRVYREGPPVLHGIPGSRGHLGVPLPHPWWTPSRGSWRTATTACAP